MLIDATTCIPVLLGLRVVHSILAYAVASPACSPYAQILLSPGSAPILSFHNILSDEKKKILLDVPLHNYWSPSQSETFMSSSCCEN